MAPTGSPETTQTWYVPRRGIGSPTKPLGSVSPQRWTLLSVARVAHTLIPAADLPLAGQETVTKMCALAVIVDKAVASKQIAMCFSLICVEIVFDCVCSVSQAPFMASLVVRRHWVLVL